MPGVGKLLKQAQKMQKAMETVQAQLAEFLKEDAASIEASIVAAVEDAAAKARAKSEEEMNKITGGFSIPGLV